MGMMKKIFFLTLLFSISLNSQKKTYEVLSKYDSIINHTVQKKETLFSLSKKYGLSIDEIIKANPGIQIDKLKRRTILIIPSRKKNVAKDEINYIVDSIKKDSIPLSDLKLNEVVIFSILVFLIILLGIKPNLLLDYSTSSLDRIITLYPISIL